MKSLRNSRDRTEILERMRKLTPESQRQWGRMNAHQMSCHVSDAFKAAMDIRGFPCKGTLFQRTIVKWIGLYVPVPWPKGFRARRELDQERGGTKPIEFQKDLIETIALLERFSADNRDFKWGLHPLFGNLTESEWLRWGYLHTDHHLRQFGL